MIAALVLAAHWVAWDPDLIQMGVAFGRATEEHLIAMIPPEGCSDGMRIYSGRFGEFDVAMDFIAASKVCDIVDARRIRLNAKKRGVP